MSEKKPFKLTFWGVVAIIILLFGLYTTFVRFSEGLGAVTNLSDEFPWGLWIGFDILTGVALAAGGFTVSALVHIFNVKKYEPLSRPAILTAFLGYVFVAIALLYDIGKPWNLWHPLIMWNPHSVMFEVAWCVMLYTTVLLIEFSSFALEKFQAYKVLRVLRKVMVPVFILGIVLSTLHQSSLGSVYLIVPTKMHPLWYSTFLPVHFYISAIGVGFAMVVFESFLSARAFNHGLEAGLLRDTSRIVLVITVIAVLAKFIDLLFDGKFNLLFIPQMETYMFWLEIIIGSILPIIILSSKQLIQSRVWLFTGSSLVVMGLILNRMNVSITSLVRSSGVDYFPSVSEIGITLFVVTLGVLIFKYVAENFPVFEHEVHDNDASTGGAEPVGK